MARSQSKTISGDGSLKRMIRSRCPQITQITQIRKSKNTNVAATKGLAGIRNVRGAYRVSKALR